jgi:hypothetical protein
VQVFQAHDTTRPGKLSREFVMGVFPDMGNLTLKAGQFHPGLLVVLATPFALWIVLFPTERARETLQLLDLLGERFLVFKPPTIADNG